MKNFTRMFTALLRVLPPLAAPVLAQGFPAKHIDDNLGAATDALPDAATRRKMAAHIDGL